MALLGEAVEAEIVTIFRKHLYDMSHALQGSAPVHGKWVEAKSIFGWHGHNRFNGLFRAQHLYDPCDSMKYYFV